MTEHAPAAALRRYLAQLPLTDAERSHLLDLACAHACALGCEGIAIGRRQVERAQRNAADSR
jgi:hypothetical protein